MPILSFCNLTKILQDIDTSNMQHSHLDTPHGRTYPPPKTIQELKVKVKQDLGKLYDGGDDFALKSFSHLNTPEWEKRIKAFVLRTPLYDNSESVWSNVPQTTTRERDLSEPLVEIIEAVINEPTFGIADRMAFNSSRIYVQHEEEHAEMLDSSQVRPEEREQLDQASEARDVLKSAPDIMVLGRRGRCFKHEEFPDKPGYGSCATIWEAKLNGNTQVFLDHVVQLYVYARQCFAEQRNRNFLHAFLITETHQLFQFNRALTVHSSRINYHEKSEDFIRMVLGMVDTDESRLGFDTSVFWTTQGGERVRKIQLVISGPKEDVEVSEEVPIEGEKWIAKDVRGRATTCWSITYQGVRRLVKTLWRAEGRTAEWEFYQLVKKHNVKGVACMLCYEDGGTALTNASLMGMVFGKDEMDIDRTWCRVTFTEYGPTLDAFKSVLHLLCALYDAVNGHLGLWLIGILHRDASLNNVLFGSQFWKKKDPLDPAIEVGNRGVLIDLDLAIFIKRTDSNRNDILTGTRTFQSIKILRGGGHPHDYLDDLESFFLLLAWLCLRYEIPWRPRETIPNLIKDWDDENPRASANAKSAFMNEFDDLVVPQISDDLSKPILVKLLRGLLKVLRAAWHPDRFKPCPLHIRCVADLHPNAESVYKKFLRRIEIAIKEQKALDGQKTSSTDHPILAATVERDPTSPSPAQRVPRSAPNTIATTRPLKTARIFPSAPAGPSNPNSTSKRKKRDCEEQPKQPKRSSKRVRLWSATTIRPDDLESQEPGSSRSAGALRSSPDPLITWGQPVSSHPRNVVSAGEGRSKRKHRGGQR